MRFTGKNLAIVVQGLLLLKQARAEVSTDKLTPNELCALLTAFLEARGIQARGVEVLLDIPGDRLVFRGVLEREALK
jgi:hypothetical protein